MHQRGSIVPALVGIAFIVIIVGAIIYLVVSSIAGREPEEELLPEESPVAVLGSQRSVRIDARGPIVAKEEHNQYRITITPDSREMNLYQGYTNDVVQSVRYGNTPQAYEEFVFALEREGLGRKERDVSDDEADPRGACPTSRVYIFTVLDGGREVDSWWRGACSKEGTLDMQVHTLVGLFERQIPEYKDLTRNIRL